VVRRHFSGHHRPKYELCPHLEGHRGPLFGSGGVLVLCSLQRQIQRRGHPDGDPIRGRARGGQVCKLDRRWSTRTGVIDLWSDGIRGRSCRPLGLQTSAAMKTVPNSVTRFPQHGWIPHARRTAAPAKCPLSALSGHGLLHRRCPLSGVEQTSA